jgi:hypothetical protein
VVEVGVPEVDVVEVDVLEGVAVVDVEGVVEVVDGGVTSTGVGSPGAHNTIFTALRLATSSNGRTVTVSFDPSALREVRMTVPTGIPSGY